MTLLAYGADIGLTSLTGNSEKDSLSLMIDLENVQFPLVKTNSGQTWTLAWGPVVLSKFEPVRWIRAVSPRGVPMGKTDRTRGNRPALMR